MQRESPASVHVRALVQSGTGVQLGHVSGVLGAPGSRYVPDAHAVQRASSSVEQVSCTVQPLISAHWKHAVWSGDAK